MRQLLPSLIAFLIRTLALTLRFKIIDRTGISRGEVKSPVIWAFWHNRILMSTMVYQRACPERRGAVLTSPSKDGDILAAVMTKFNADSVRGSSSRRGATALRELAAVLEGGIDVAITPDGPRGPVYKLEPGIIKVAQVTGARIVPFHTECSAYWELRTWDGFRIPKPFSTVTATFDTFLTIPQVMDKEAFERERSSLEALMASNGTVKPVGADSGSV